MTGPLNGVRIVELGFWVAGPAAAGILADWGAEVVKIEPPDGDPLRGFLAPVHASTEANPRSSSTTGASAASVSTFEQAVDRPLQHAW